MSVGYLLRRIVVFFVVMWAAMTLIFFLPKLAPGRDPIQDRMAMLAATGGANSANILVQDRLTGQINEERMSVYVRLGIRLLYKAMGSREMEKKRSKSGLLFFWI